MKILTCWLMYWSYIANWLVWELACLRAQKYCNTWLVFTRVSLISWGDGDSFVLVGYPPGDGFTINYLMVYMFYYINQPCNWSFHIGLVKTECWDWFRLQSVKTLIIAIHTHVVKVYNNNRNFSFLPIIYLP